MEKWYEYDSTELQKEYDRFVERNQGGNNARMQELVKILHDAARKTAALKSLWTGCGNTAGSQNWTRLS